MNRGVPPTDLKARTGEFTPPGITAHASANSRADAAVRASASTPGGVASALHMVTSVPARAHAPTTGCSCLARLGQHENRMVGLERQSPEVALDHLAGLLAIGGQDGLPVLFGNLLGQVVGGARLGADRDVRVGPDILDPLRFTAGGHQELGVADVDRDHGDLLRLLAAPLRHGECFAVGYA